MKRAHLIIIIALLWAAASARGQVPQAQWQCLEIALCVPDTARLDTGLNRFSRMHASKPEPVSIYALPYSLNGESRDWHRLWVNTAVLSSAFVGTLLVLECLPEDATTWNRAELQKTPPFNRWFNNIFKRGPEWDHDNPVFNYVLHPYAGAAYFMAARSNGFNFWRSMLYSACISTIGWEFGIEAFMERPSYQDLFITPICGSLLGEGFYRAKRYIVEHDYELLGSRLLGNVAAVLLDPVNEVIGIFDGNPARRVAAQISLQPMLSPSCRGFSLVATF